ncbi:MAG: hypothetical protein HN582_15535 [Marinovum sp.]|nr:hypothetical protein [Marinovum sp.]
MPTDPDLKVDNRFRWLPTAAKHYHLHKEQGTSIRTIARSLGAMRQQFQDRSGASNGREMTLLSKQP